MLLRDSLTIQGICCTVQHRAGPHVAVVRCQDGSVVLAVRALVGWRFEPSRAPALDLLSAIARAVDLATQ